MPEVRRHRLAAALVVLLAAGVYANTLSYGAAWDDTRFVFQSGATDGVGAAAGLFTSPYLRDVPAGRSPYRPITALSYALDWTLGGGQASFFHKTNVVLHAGVTGVLMAVMAALSVPIGGVLVGGAWFAVHPVHAEAVANLAGRAELLAAFFGLLSMWLFLGGAPIRSATSKRWGGVRLVGSLLCFAVALGAKENAVVMLPLLGVLEWMRPDADSGRARLRLWPYWAALGMLTLMYLLARSAVLGTFTTYDVAPFIGSLPAGTRIATAVANVWEYARLTLVPIDLVVDYGPAVVLPSPAFSLGFLRGLAVLVGTALACAALWRRSRLPSLGMLWFAVAMLPVSNLLVPIAQWLAERFLYLPSAGAALAIGAAFALVKQGTAAHRRATLLAGLVVLLLGARLVDRNRTWRDTDTVARTLIAEHPEAFRAQWLLGGRRLEAGDVEGGMAALDRAAELNPGAMEIHLERAYWMLRMGRPQDAEVVLRALPPAMHADREAHLTRSLLRQRRREEALDVLAAGLAAFPQNDGLRALADSVRGR